MGAWFTTPQRNNDQELAGVRQRVTETIIDPDVRRAVLDLVQAEYESDKYELEIEEDENARSNSNLCFTIVCIYSLLAALLNFLAMGLCVGDAATGEVAGALVLTALSVNTLGLAIARKYWADAEACMSRAMENAKERKLEERKHGRSQVEGNARAKEKSADENKNWYLNTEQLAQGIGGILGLFLPGYSAMNIDISATNPLKTTGPSAVPNNTKCYADGNTSNQTFVYLTLAAAISCCLQIVSVFVFINKAVQEQAAARRAVGETTDMVARRFISLFLVYRELKEEVTTAVWLFPDNPPDGFVVAGLVVAKASKSEIWHKVSVWKEGVMQRVKGLANRDGIFSRFWVRPENAVWARLGNAADSPSDKDVIVVEKFFEIYWLKVLKKYKELNETSN